MTERLMAEMRMAEAKAFDSLGRYKFEMFGYWAAIWVHLNKVGGFHLPNPFKGFVLLAREKRPGMKPIYESEREYWIIITLYGEKCPIPVHVIGQDNDQLIVEWRITDVHEEHFDGIEPNGLYETEADALNDLRAAMERGTHER